MKPVAFILSKWETGLGDCYSNIITGYSVLKDFEKLGYDVFFIKDVKRNLYYSNSYPLSYIFNFAPFENKIIFESHENYTKNFLDLPQKNNTIKIYVSEVIPSVRNYQYKILNTPTFVYTPEEHEYAYRDVQFLSVEVLNIMNSFIENKKEDLSGMCIRVADTHIASSVKEVLLDSLHKDITIRAYDFFENCCQKNIFIASSNKNIAKYVASLDSRAFTFNFTHNFEMHCGTVTEDVCHIRHAQEIAATMGVFSRCKKIRQIIGNLSSFLNYGFAHNVHYLNITATAHNVLL